jgi:hypothetical protein
VIEEDLYQHKYISWVGLQGKHFGTIYRIVIYERTMNYKNRRIYRMQPRFRWLQTLYCRRLCVLNNNTKTISYERRDSQGNCVKGLYSIATFKITLQSCKSQISFSCHAHQFFHTLQTMHILHGNRGMVCLKFIKFCIWRMGKMWRKVQIRSSRSWTRDHSSHMSHLSLGYTKSKFQTNYTENQDFYSVTSAMIKQNTVATKQCYTNEWK